MSLRGSGTTEAISKGTENGEIAALPPVARNDKKGLPHNLQRRGGHIMDYKFIWREDSNSQGQLGREMKKDRDTREKFNKLDFALDKLNQRG